LGTRARIIELVAAQFFICCFLVFGVHYSFDDARGLVASVGC